MKQRAILVPWRRWATILRAKVHHRLRLPIPAVRETSESRICYLFSGQFPSLSSAASTIPLEVLDHYLEHRFDIFGCGWLSFSRNQSEPGSFPLVWNSDLRSGGEWQSAKFEYGSGKDIKFPWEFSRLHHLPQMAWYFLAHGKNQEARRLRIPGEVVAVLRDFSRQNPMGEGVNWANAMEASIRAANIVVALNLLRAAGHRFSSEEELLFAKILKEHGRFVTLRLEWYREGRGNHYLANLTGLIFCGFSLAPSQETNRWLDFAAREWRREFDRQFLPDGGNFEGSLFYHRLSLELSVFAWGLLAGREGASRLKPEWRKELLVESEGLVKAFSFLRGLTDSTGRGVQIGDNDSGRLFKLSPRFVRIHGRLTEDDTFTEDTLGILANGERSAEGLLYDCLGGPSLYGKKPGDYALPSSKESPQPAPGAVRHFFPLAIGSPVFLVAEAFPSFGVYSWRGKELEVWIRCGRASGDGHGGHAHFDQLHAEIRWQGRPITLDPGSLGYTSDLRVRNDFRGPAAHFVPRSVEHETLADNAEDPFRYRGLPNGEVLEFSAEGFCGRYQIGNAKLFRRLRFFAEGVEIMDWAEGTDSFLSEKTSGGYVSAGYGKPWSPWEGHP